MQDVLELSDFMPLLGLGFLVEVRGFVELEF